MDGRDDVIPVSIDDMPRMNTANTASGTLTVVLRLKGT